MLLTVAIMCCTETLIKQLCQSLVAEGMGHSIFFTGKGWVTQFLMLLGDGSMKIMKSCFQNDRPIPQCYLCMLP